MKTALEQLESWIEQFYKINGTPTLDDIKGQINLLKDYETEQLAIPRVSNSVICDDWIHEERVKQNDDTYCPICGKQLQSK